MYLQDPPRLDIASQRPAPQRSAENKQSDYFTEKKPKMRKASGVIHEISDSDGEIQQSRNASPPFVSTSTLDTAIQISKSAPPTARRVDRMVRMQFV